MIKPIEIFLKDLSQQWKFIKDFKKQDVFKDSFNHTEELEIVLHRNSFRCKFIFDNLFKKLLMYKFIQYLNENHDKPKFISRLNFALERVLFLEHRKDFKDEALRFVFLYENKILSEVRRFNKWEKTYVLENFFKFFNGNKKYIAFINELNLIFFDKATRLAFYAKKTILLGTLDSEQTDKVKKFAA